MSEDRTEKEKAQPIKEVAIGEWFNPFVNYEDTPLYSDRYESDHGYYYGYRLGGERLHWKDFPFQVHPIGKFTAQLGWVTPYPREFLQETTHRIVIVSPTGNIETDIKSFKIYEEKLESRLMLLNLRCNDDKFIEVKGGKVPKHFPYKVEIALLSGEVLSSNFRITEVPPGGDEVAKGIGTKPAEWYAQDGVEPVALIFPEVENILEKIQMRIVPIAESQRSSQ